MSHTSSKNRPRWKRLWIYQKERFPLAAHGPLVAAFGVAAVTCSRLLRNPAGTFPLGAALAACGLGLLFFWLLRVADEFKDLDRDRRFRPQRPVPRGLVSLRELGALAAGAAAVQLAIVLLLAPALWPFLVGAWAYFGLMSAEFFAPRWLSACPLLYLLSHMLIMPLIALLMSACDWRAAEAAWPTGLGWFLGASFFTGVVLEIGRKMRAPGDEQRGVETYTASWGHGAAVSAWIGALIGAGGCAVMAATRLEVALPAGVVLGALGTGAVAAALRFWQHPTTKRAGRLETLAGLWTLGVYLVLGALPWG